MRFVAKNLFSFVFAEKSNNFLFLGMEIVELTSKMREKYNSLV